MNLRETGIIGVGIAFARSDHGKRLISQARQKYDTPENRAKAKDTVAALRKARARRA